MIGQLRVWIRVLVVACVVSGVAVQVRADEIWVAPTLQQDAGGLGIASNTYWPVTVRGVSRFAWGIPSNLQIFQNARVVLVPHAPGGAATLNIVVCAAQNGQPVAGSCAGPFVHAFTGVVNQLLEINIAADLAPKIGTSGLNNLAVLAYTTPTTNTDHIVGLRFVYRGSARFDTVNTSVGYHALPPSAGTLNTAVGGSAMQAGASGSRNTAVGSNSMLESVIAGDGNTSVGAFALEQLTAGSNNTAIGINALREVHSASDNTAVGAGANFAGGAFNTAVGSGSLGANDGSYNAALGYQSLGQSDAGERNTAVGAFAMTFSHPLSQGNDNVAIGYRAGFNIGAGDYNIHIANEGQEEGNTLRIGTAFSGVDSSGQNRAFIAGIRGITTGTANATPVVIDSNGQLGTISSSRRFKEDIHDIAGASQRLFQLRPVTFRYKQPYNDGSKPINYGLVAEEVAEVFPELAVRGADGEIETVHYETLNVLLLNEVQTQQHEIEQARQRIEKLEQQLEALLGAALSPQPY